MILMNRIKGAADNKIIRTGPHLRRGKPFAFVLLVHLFTCYTSQLILFTIQKDKTKSFLIANTIIGEFFRGLLPIDFKTFGHWKNTQRDSLPLFQIEDKIIVLILPLVMIQIVSFIGLDRNSAFKTVPSTNLIFWVHLFFNEETLLCQLGQFLLQRHTATDIGVSAAKFAGQGHE